MSLRPTAPALLAVAICASACATARPPAVAYDDLPATPARLVADPPAAAEIVETPTPLPLPGQLQPVETDPEPEPEPGDPPHRIVEANAAARMEPVRDGFINAMQVYPWTEGALYQVYAAPGQVTDIALQAGEILVGSGPVAAGDTARWIIGDTVSGAGAGERVHILVKPTRPDLSTNLVINTDRRTYHLELRATPRTWMASVSWIYPHDRLIALRARNAAAAQTAPAASGIDVARLSFQYRVEGDAPPWRPLRAFDDGVRVFIQFPPDVGRGELPPLFILGADGGAELVNYRVRGETMVVDRLFAAAELRLGDDPQSRVRIVRGDAAARRTGRGARR